MANFLQSRDHGKLNDASFSENVKPLRMRRRNVSVMTFTSLGRNKPSSSEGLMIDGSLECAMAHHETHLTISKHARVEADIHAGTVVVFGQLIGDIFSGGKVSLVKGSEVHGNISCSCLYMEDGARFMGRVEMG